MRSIVPSFLLLLGFVGITPFVNAEEKAPAVKETKGKVIITLYGDFHSGFGSQKDNRHFFLDRAYLGYQYQIGKELKIKAVLDAGRSKEVDDLQRIAYLKDASLTWKHKRLTLAAGLISTTQFQLQNKSWNKRYIQKTFQDEYKFGHSADLGVSIGYAFTSRFSADAILTNGDGYKKIELKDGLHYGLGITFKPIEGWVIRAYGSLNETDDKSLKDVYNLSFFTGYRYKGWSIGGEYNYMFNAQNQMGKHRSGASAFTDLQVHRKIALYAKWDYVLSKDNWNLEKDGMAGIIGADFMLGKYVRLSPNFRIWSPADKSASKEYYAYLNFAFFL